MYNISQQILNQPLIAQSSTQHTNYSLSKVVQQQRVHKARLRQVCSCQSTQSDVSPAKAVPADQIKEQVSENNVSSAQKSAQNPVERFMSKANELKDKIVAYGPSGLAAYGLVNTLYYVIAITAVWFTRFQPSLATSATTGQQAVIECITLVWAGSQVTKLLRASVALALAPPTDKLLNKIMDQFDFEDKNYAVGLLALASFGLVGVLVGLLVVQASS